MRERESLVGGPTHILVLEHIEGVNLSQLNSFLSAIQPPQRASFASEVLRQLVSIVSYLRRCGIIHGDLAPENLILQPNGLIKLIDFGVARRESEPQHDFKVAGRLNFRAPELRTSGETTYEGDVFAIGRIYEHLLGEENSTLEPHSTILDQLLEKRELPRLDLEQGWFRGVQPMPPAELLQQRAVIRAKTKILKIRRRWMTRERLNALILLIAFPFLTSWLPQLGTLTINSLPSSMVLLPGATSPLATPLVNIRLPAGRQRLQFIIQSQQNRRVIREISIQPNEHLKLFEDFRKN